MLWAVILVVVASATQMPLTLLDKGVAEASGALCLDGSAAGFYYQKGQSPDKFVIYLQGGGWCYNETLCVARSKTRLGSSTHFPASMGGSAIFSESAADNPFWDFSKVLLPYCDGASFTGNRATPVTVNGTTLHFGGKRILTQILKVLMGEPYNLGTAKEVLLTGCSAGGLATYLNADYVASLLPPSVERYKAAPISGFFLDVPSLTSVPVYPDEMRYVYHMQNCSVNAACVAAHAASPADCMFAEHSVAHIATPLFVQNSAYDSWQLNNIFLPQVSGWGACIHQVDNCTSQQIRVLNADWQTAFVRRVVQPDWFWRNTTGCFLHSVISHCLGDHDWNGPLRIDNVTVAQAWWNWYADATATNRHVGCTLNEKAPHQCAE